MKWLVMIYLMLTLPLVDITDAGLITPDNPLYPLDLAFDNFVEVIVSVINPSGAIYIKIQHLHERIAELYLLEINNESSKYPELIKMIEDKIEDISRYCEEHQECKDVVNTTLPVIKECLNYTESKCKCSCCKEKIKKIVKKLDYEWRWSYEYKRSRSYNYSYGHSP